MSEWKQVYTPLDVKNSRGEGGVGSLGCWIRHIKVPEMQSVKKCKQKPLSHSPPVFTAIYDVFMRVEMLNNF